MRFRAIHNTGVSYSDVKNQLWAVNNYHRKKFNMKSSLGFYVSYNGFIDGDGTFTQTRLIGDETAAIVGHNCDKPQTCDTIHFCIAFNGDKEVLNQAQRKTLKRLYKGDIKLRTLSLDFDITGLEDKFHRDLQFNRTCPGKLMTYDYIKDVLKEDEPMSHKEDLDNLQRKLTLIELLKKLVALLIKKRDLIIKRNT